MQTHFQREKRPHCDNVNVEKEDSELLGFVFAQFLAHDGLKKFGKKGEDAVHGEMKQPHKRDAFKPRWVNELSEEEKKRALDLILLMEEKQDGRVKGQGVANGSKQRGCVAKEDAASPTASLESIILTRR